MSNTALIRREETSLINPRENEWTVMREMATVALKSGMLPNHIKTEQAALFIVMKGRELGIPATYALSNIIVIQGKPTTNAELMLALIYRDHGDNAIQFSESTPAKCTVLYKRKAWASPLSQSYTIEEAKTAGLLSNQTWQKYPKAMLRARCISAVARLAFPDSIGGMYTPEELGAQVMVTDDDQITIVEQSQPQQPLSIVERIDAHQEATTAQPIIEAQAIISKAEADALRELGFRKGYDLDAIAQRKRKPLMSQLTPDAAAELRAWLEPQTDLDPGDIESPGTAQPTLTNTQKQIEYFYSELAKSGKERFAAWDGQHANFNAWLSKTDIEFNQEVSSIADIPDEIGKRYANYLGDMIAVNQEKKDDPLM